jgi:uncharacterized membrane protein YfcA
MTLLGLLSAALIGVSLGIMGAGGSVLTVPIFVYVLGLGAKEAIASSLVVVGATSLLGALKHRQEGHMRLRVALVFGTFSMIGAYVGAQLAGFFSDAAQLILFAVVMLGAAFVMLRDEESGEGGEHDGSPDGSPGGHAARRMVLKLAAPGMAVGVLTGLVGVGGGFLIVPVLVLLADVPMKATVGTSLLVIAMNSAAGFAGYLGAVDLQWALVAAFTALAAGGSFVGTYLARFLSGAALKRGFAVFLVLMAVFILYQSWG